MNHAYVTLKNLNIVSYHLWTDALVFTIFRSGI